MIIYKAWGIIFFMAKICVFCSSSDKISEDYLLVARELGDLMGERGHQLIYGGTHRGLMGETSKSFAKHSGEITEIIPKIFEEIAVKSAKIIVTEDFGERLRKMEEHSDAFITLSGGFGSLYEIMDVLICKQLKLHQKPLVVVNTGGIYTPLINQIKKMIEEGFAPEDNHKLIEFVSTPKEALEYIENYMPVDVKDKKELWNKAPIKERPKVGIGVVIKKDGKVLLGKRKGSLGKDTWSFTGGHLEFGESFEECASRETLEETDIKIKNIKLLTTTNDIFESKHYITIFLTADHDSGEVKTMEPEKFVEWKWFETDKLPKPLFPSIENLLKSDIKI